VGADFDLAALISDRKAIYLFLGLLVAAYLVKLVPSLIMVPGFSWRKAVSGGFLLSSRLTLIIAAAAIGLRLGVIDSTTNSAIILIAIVTCSLSPALFSTLLEREAGPEEAHPVLIAGGDRVAILLARRLAVRGIPTTLLQRSTVRAEKLRWKGFDTVQCDLLDEEAWEKAGVERSRTVVVATEDDNMTLKVARFLKATMGVDRIVAWVHDAGSLSRFEELGVVAVNPLINGAAVLDMLINTPDTYQILSRATEDKEVLEVRLLEPGFVGKPLREVRIPGDVLILSIRREGEVFVPHGDTVLHRGDCLTLLGSRDLVEQAAMVLGRVECDDVFSEDHPSYRFYLGEHPFLGE
jgi:Trk K+ transport system NAD-binding subunit